MTKIYRRIFAVLASFVLAIYGGVVGRLSTTFSVKAEQTSVTPFETTSVIDDLKDSTIEGEPFNLENFPADQNKELRLISFLEYCYTKDDASPDDYNLYLYVYNPKCLNFAENTILNKVAISFGGDGSYKKYSIRVVNYSMENGYEKVLYKFKVVLTTSEKTKIIRALNKDGRVYNISSIELLQEGKRNAEDYTVAKSFTYKGYVSGVDGEFLTYSSAEIETLQLDVSPTQFRPDGYSKNEYTQDSLHSVYFAIPNSVIKERGKMSKVHATWLNAVLKPSLVIGDKSVYEAIKPYLGVNIGTRNSQLEHIYFGDFEARGETNASMKYYCGYAYNCDRMLFGADSYKYGEQITTLNMIITTPNGEDPYNGVITSSMVIDEMLKMTNILGGVLVNGKYSRALFESVDSEFTDIEISADDDFDLTSTVIDMDFWKWLFGQNLEVTTQFNGIKAIYAVKAEDLTGTDEEISKRLFVGKQDVAHLKTTFASVSKDHTLYLFRYQVSDYVSQRATHCTWDRFLWKETFEPGTAHGYFFKETVNLDFDVIDVTFTKGLSDTIIPIVSNPVDVVPSPTPPPDIIEPVPDPNWYDGLLEILKWSAFVVVILIGVNLISVIFFSGNNKEKRK